jgi:predicted alpha/beta hydrolase family esterase
MRTLIVPGLNGSGPGHWQTLWEEKYGYKRVEQRDWEKPDLLEWIYSVWQKKADFRNFDFSFYGMESETN